MRRGLILALTLPRCIAKISPTLGFTWISWSAAVVTASPLDELRNRPPMNWLRERDIDLLICSELHSAGSPLHKLFIGGWNNGVARFDGAWVSYVDAEGETDIVASFKSGDKSLVLLIENKIDAAFQPEQPERYRRRAQRWNDRSASSVEVETVLLAPNSYFENAGSELFDRQISYEEVIMALATSSDPRTRFLAQTLKDGIESYRRGYKALPDDTATRVWHAIWETANLVAPQLRMESPGSKPAGAGFIHLDEADGVSTAETQRRVKIVYKAVHGNADLQFANTREATLRDAVGSMLAADMSVAAAGKSASIRIKIPYVDFGLLPDKQKGAIRQGLQAAERLRVFYIEQQPLELIPAH